MAKGISRIVEYGIRFAPPGLILGASLLNLTAIERQLLMLVLLIWVNGFFLLQAWRAG